MIHDHCYQVFGSSEVMLPFLQSLDDGEELPIIDVIVSLSWREGGRVIGTGMEISVGVLLHKYSSRGGKGGVCHDKEGFGGVRHLDNWGCQECLLELDESIILFLSPVEGHPFLCQIKKRSSECREVGDELLVKVAESNEGSDGFD